MSTVYTVNGKVLKNAANDKWLTKKEEHGPSYIVPDMVPDPNSEYGLTTIYNGPKVGGNKLDYNTTYQINYPTGVDISTIRIAYYYSNSWTYVTIAEGSPNSITTLKISDYLTSSRWDDTQEIDLQILNNGTTIYEPTTLTPIS